MASIALAKLSGRVKLNTASLYSSNKHLFGCGCIVKAVDFRPSGIFILLQGLLKANFLGI